MRRLLAFVLLLSSLPLSGHSGIIMRGSGGASSEWSKVGEDSGYVPTLGGSKVFTLPGPPQEGDLVVAAGACDGDYPPTITETGYTTAIDSGTTSPLEWMIYKVMGGTPDTTLTLTSDAPTDRRVAAVVQVWRGGYSAGILDSAYVDATTGDSTTPDPPAITTANNNALVFALGYMDDDDTTANGISKNTELASTFEGATVGMASKQVSVAGSEDPGTFTFGATDQWRAGTISFRRNP
jgi:hypothetical protein